MGMRHPGAVFRGYSAKDGNFLGYGFFRLGALNALVVNPIVAPSGLFGHGEVRRV